MNDNLDKMGGFFTSLQYGVLFPLGGLGYMVNETDPQTGQKPGTQTAQTVKWYLGIMF